MKPVVTFILIMASLTSHAQFEIAEEESKANLGFGLGISYGGIGARLSFYPQSMLPCSRHADIISMD
jgi:hypothetical protein